MLLLLFTAGEQRFGVDVAAVLEVVPAPALQAIPHAPEWLAGFFAYRGAATPVVDASVLLTARRCRRLLSTRVILVECRRADGRAHVLGIMAEQVVETVFCAVDQMQPPVAAFEEAPYLGDLLPDSSGFIQTVTVDRLLPESAQEILFSRGG